MKKLEVVIKNGVFTEASGEVQNFSPKKIIGLGWLAQIKDDGSLEAFTKDTTDEGVFSVKAVLKPGLFVETKRLTKSDGTYVKMGKKEHKIPGIDGVLILTSGDVTKRYCHHLHKGFVNFKKAFSIDNVINEEPNQVFATTLDAVIYTDGKCSKYLAEGNNCYLDVSDATWALLEKFEETGEKVRLLYTRKPHNKVDLPKVLSSSGRAEITRLLKKDFETVSEALEYISTLNIFKKNIYEVEECFFDKEVVKAIYYITDEGFLNIFVNRTLIWESRESLEKSRIDTDFVIEGKDYFYKTSRILEAVAFA